MAEQLGDPTGLARPIAKAHVILGNQARQSGNTTAALAAYRRALELVPDLKEAQERIATLQGG